MIYKLLLSIILVKLVYAQNINNTMKNTQLLLKGKIAFLSFRNCGMRERVESKNSI